MRSRFSAIKPLLGVAILFFEMILHSLRQMINCVYEITHTDVHRENIALILESSECIYFIFHAYIWDKSEKDS